MRKKFLHCLRIQFPPKHYEDERIAEVVDYCVKYGFKNVMLFINMQSVSNSRVSETFLFSLMEINRLYNV